MSRWQRWNEKLGRIEKFLVAAMLSAMILLAFLQILLRNAFSTGVSWADPLVRYLVLWVAFIGASLAGKEGKHITIEVFSGWLAGHGSRYLKAISNLISTLICGLMTYAGWIFVQNEAQMGSAGILEIPVWIMQVIIPISFALMTLRFGFSAFSALAIVHRPDNYSKHGKHR